ncbi:MAG: CoA transferase [Acidimicrobiales bacterium]
MLGEHAAALELSRGGAISCGGSARLLPAADGWLAVNLARDDDRDSVPAWLELAGRWDPDDPWPTVEREVATRSAAGLVDRAALLAMPVARVGEVEPPPPADALGGLPIGLPIEPTVGPTVGPTGPGDAGATTVDVDGALVVDLSSLWAGPLCARLLADRGARVVKVESTGRPDGARLGPAAFFDRLHAGTRSVGLDLATRRGAAALRRLVERADVVIEASRPRALRALGIEPTEVMPQGRCRVWVSITGYGRDSPRVAFGDDAAAAGGLVAWDGSGPCFAVDAVADPLTGMAAAAGVDAALATGGRWLLDVSMAGVAALVAGPDRCLPWLPDGRLTPSPPSAPAPVGSGPALGADTDRIGAELGLALR